MAITTTIKLQSTVFCWAFWKKVTPIMIMYVMPCAKYEMVWSDHNFGRLSIGSSLMNEKSISRKMAAVLYMNVRMASNGQMRLHTFGMTQNIQLCFRSRRVNWWKRQHIGRAIHSVFHVLSKSDGINHGTTLARCKNSKHSVQ